mmetsp:Transcript_17323/g.47992  ORF Transcript_17323/g.47992 Transcript_17323/m.47992 type:complete len:269 (+) Transcript_17323:121-927(+)
MPQRRAVAGSQKDAEEMVPFSETLETGNAPGRPRPSAPPSASSAGGASTGVSLEERYNSETLNAKQQNWMDGPFASSMQDESWKSEYAKFRADPYRQCMDSTRTDAGPCDCCSVVCCGIIGAERVGHMAVLKQSMEVVEEVVDNGDGSEPSVRRYKRPKLDIVIGPYWPMLLCITYPLILGVSGLALVTVIPKTNPFVQLLWGCTTLGLIYALAMTAFRDPGILPRYVELPPHSNDQWRWSDRTYSFKPRGAYYDPDTGVIVEEFDHT